MKRRIFVKSAVIGSAAAVIPFKENIAASVLKSADMMYYELRIYQLNNIGQQQIVEDYFKTVAIPVMNRLGVKHVGVFTEMKPTGQARLFVLIPYHSMDHFASVTNAMDEEADMKNHGATYFNAPAAQPAYERIESSLLKAFTHMPALVAPENKPRIFELRQYQSASESAGLRKIDMFNNQGEINIFKRLGFNPVFWGQTIIGTQRPNLTYMLTFDDLAAKEAHWKAFGSDAEWKKISSVPENADALLVNKITSTLLVPTDYSQI